MTLDEAIADMAERYVLHPAYRAANHPHHSAYAEVDVRVTFMRVRGRMRQPRPAPSFSDAVAQAKQRLRVVHS